MSEKKRSLLGGFWSGLGADGIEDEIDDCVSKEDNDKTEDGVENGVFGVGDFFTVAAGDDVADAAPDEHDDREGANDGEGDAGELGEDAIVADEFGRHAFGAGNFRTFLNGESHGFTSAKREAGADASDDL